jgi:hypothetical protein
VIGFSGCFQEGVKDLGAVGSGNGLKWLREKRRRMLAQEPLGFFGGARSVVGLDVRFDVRVEGRGKGSGIVLIRLEKKPPGLVSRVLQRAIWKVAEAMRLR